MKNRSFIPNPEDRYIAEIDAQRILTEQAPKRDIQGLTRAQLIQRAKKNLIANLRSKLLNMRSGIENKNVEISTPSLIVALDLTETSPPISEQELDLIAVIPGIEKTSIGYKIASREIFLEKTGGKLNQLAKTLKFFQDNPEKEYSAGDIQANIGLKKDAAWEAIRKLLAREKIYVARIEKQGRPKQGKRLFKLKTT